MSSAAPPPPSYPPGGSGPAGPPAGGGSGGPGGYPSYPSGGGPSGDTDAKGFFGSLFDFSFNSFVTPKIVKFVYILATILIGLFLVFFVIAGFARSVGSGLVTLVIGAILAIFYLALIRMTLEFYYSVVRMSEDIHRRLPGR